MAFDAESSIYGNGTTTATSGANTVIHHYDRAGVKSATEMNVYGQWADKKNQPLKKGKTYKISKWLHIYDRELVDSNGNLIQGVAGGYLSSRDIADVSAGLTATTLAEGAGAVNKVSIKKVTMESSFARYGNMIDYTDEVEMFSEDAIQVRYREELGYLANRNTEDLIQLDMLASTNVMYSGVATAIGEVGATTGADGAADALSQVDYDLIRKASRKLVRNRAIKNTSTVTGSTKVDTKTINKAYYAIVGPEIKFDLENQVRGSGNEAEFVFVPAYKYAAAANLAEGEVGSMHDVRFIESESAVIYAGQGYFADAWRNDSELTHTDPRYATEAEAIAGGAGASATLVAYTGALSVTANGVEGATKFDVFPMLFPTQGSFATIGLRGKDKIKFNAKSPAMIENGNPYGTTGFFSYNFWYAGIILQEEKLLKVLVGASA